MLRPSSSARRRLEAGSLLLRIVATLRWSDGLWASPQQIHLSSDTVLGTCARTKTTRRLMPFAAVAHGLLTSPADAQGWGHVFVRALQEAAHQTKLRKMQRHAGVLLIRRLLLECYGHLGENERPDLDRIGALIRSKQRSCLRQAVVVARQFAERARTSCRCHGLYASLVWPG